MTKVCMIVHQYYYRDTRVRRYAEALVDAGARVDVLCLGDPNQPRTGRRSGIKVFPIPISRGFISYGSYMLEYGVAFILFTAWLLALYIRNRYQIIHVHNMPDFLVFSAVIPRILGARLVLDIHDPMPEVYMSKFQCQTNNAVVRVMCVQEKLSAMLAHAIITANSNFRDNLIKRGIPASKITVVNNVADPKVFNRDQYRQEPRQDKRFTLIYPGTIAPRYGLDVAIRAIPLLINKIPKLCLVVIGPHTKHVDVLTSLVEQLGVSSFVKFKPTIPVDEVPRQITQASIGIYPALPDPHMSIATPTKVLEYATMGIPIVASRLKILEDLFADSAVMFFEPGNAEQFARCVLELYSSPTRRDELVRSADTVYVRRCSWDNERSTYFNVLNQLLPPTEQVPVQGESV